MKKSFFSLVQLWKIRILLGFMIFCMPMMGFAWGSHDYDTNIRDVTYQNVYIKSETEKYISRNVNITWRQPENPSYCNYCYILFDDLNNDGEYNNQLEVFQLADHGIMTGNQYSSPTYEEQVKIELRDIKGEETVIFSQLDTWNTSTSFTYTLDEKYAGHNMGVLIFSYGLNLSVSDPYYDQYSLYGDYYSQTAILDYYLPIAQPLSLKNSTFTTVSGENYVRESEIKLSWSSFKTTGSGMMKYAISDGTDVIANHTPKTPVSSSEELTLPFLDGKHTLSIIGYDYFGNSNTTFIDICVDTTAPVLGAVNGDMSTSWTADFIHVIGIDEISDLSGIASYEYKINSGEWTVGRIILFDDGNNTGDGEYTCKFRATDRAGNVSALVSGYVNIDRTKPTVKNKPTLSFIPGSTITQLKVDWLEGYDECSKIKNYQVCYKTASINSEYSGTFTIKSNVIAANSTLTDTIDLTSLNRSAAQKIAVTIIATDNSGLAGVPDQIYSTEIILPGKVEAKSIVSSLHDSDPLNPSMKVRLKLNVTKERLMADYVNIKLIRMSSPDRTPLPPDSRLAKTIVINNAAFSKFAEEDNCVIIEDDIPSSSSAGHKYIKYEIQSMAKNNIFYESSSAGGNPTNEHLLPNNEGSISWTLTDRNGKVKTISSDGDVISTDTGFQVYDDGIVNIGFIGTDLDEELWAVEIDRAKRVHTTPDIMSYQCISGKTPIPYNTQNKVDNEITREVKLSVGTNSILCIWDEGNETDHTIVKNRSKIVNITLSASLYGVYSLNVTSDYANYDDTGITVHPGENLKIEVDSLNPAITPTYAWDFGDGASTDTQNIEHVYTQGLGGAQLTDTIVYTLKLDITEPAPSYNVTPITLPINVLDTQEGELFISEVWRGTHTIKGVVVVPSSMTLQIGSVALKKDMKVECSGGIGAGYLQGIQVQNGGTLTVDNAGFQVAFGEVDGQDRGWGTIFIENGGKATIKKSLFEHADRGITAVSGSKVDIQNSIFRENKTGLHIFGGSTVTVQGSTITENTVYGVKEENAASATMTGNRIFKNFRDYYRWNFGLLSFIEINGLPNNSNNKGE